MAINSRMVKLQFENILEHTYPHDREDLGCLVPKSPKQAEYKKFTILFPKLIWILLGSSMLMFILIWYFASEVNQREFIKAAVYVISMTVGNSVREQYGYKLRAVLISYRLQVPKINSILFHI